MRRTLFRTGMLLSGILALLLTSLPTTALAEDDNPNAQPDPMQDAARRLEMIRKMLEQDWMNPLGMPGLRMTGAAPRLGAELGMPGPTLAHQLDLPRGQGLVVHAIAAHSAADKAGLKKYDILLELNGKSVSSKMSDFARLLKDIKPNTPVDAVVMRKGKKETIKGLQLPEKKALAASPFDALGGFPRIDGLLPSTGPNSKMTTITRDKDQFTVTQKTGKQTVTVKGTITDGKPKAETVTIDDGSVRKNYEGVDKVPAEHKKHVQELIEMVAGGKTAKNA